jgi:hypothetical protein
MLATPRSAAERRRLAHLSLAGVVLLAGLAAVLLYRFPPAVYGFYPVCPVQEYLHLECPGCGSTRALAALVHGNFAEAMRQNALFVAVVLPAVVWWGLLAYVRAVRSDRFRWPQLPQPAMVAGVVAIAMFTVLRNL